MVNSEEIYAYQWLTVVEKQRSDIKFGNKMVVCIPTCGHPEIVQEVLANCAETYHRYGLDVYYFDSSENDETKNIIEDYKTKGYNNLFHIEIDPQMRVATKFEHVLMMDGIQKKYEYMWYLRERCWCEEKTLKVMYKAMERPVDLIFLDVGHPDSLQEISLCYNPNEFYHRCGDYATSMDTTIYNVETMLKNFNMENFKRRHGDYRESFLHFMIIFEQLAEMKEPKICLAAGKNVSIFHSRKGNSSWFERRMEIWAQRWLAANDALPDCYTDRENVVKRTTSLPWILGNVNLLIDLHNKGVLTPEYFNEIKCFWERVSDIPLETLRQIANGEYSIEYNPMELVQGASFSMNLILQAYQAVAEDKLSLDKLPMKEILKNVYEEAVSIGVDSELKKNVIKKTLENIERIRKVKHAEKEWNMMIMQLVIGLMILIDERR